ncbi:hypothetical protein LINPERPRIM_LOCUS10041 [Linum perenne]
MRRRRSTRSLSRERTSGADRLESTRRLLWFAMSAGLVMC